MKKTTNIYGQRRVTDDTFVPDRAANNMPLIELDMLGTLDGHTRHFHRISVTPKTYKFLTGANGVQFAATGKKQ